MPNAPKPETVLITGASAGVGRATVRQFAKHHANIALLARGQDGLEAARREVEQAGGRALVLPTDVSDHNQIEAAATATENAFGPIDIWINNAMVSVLSPAHQITIEEFRQITNVTYLGYVWGTMAALQRMRPRDHGTIVQVGSALAYRAIPLQSAYCGAKHAIAGFTESVRCELLHDKSNVHITMVQLPGVNTPQFEWMRNKMPHTPKPVGKFYQPEVAAQAIYWAAHHKRKEVYVGAPTVEAIVGDKLAASLLDHRMAAVVYQGHQTDQPDNPNRPDNLFGPLPGDHGAHGPFDDQALSSSWQLWANTHRPLLAAATATLAAAATGLLFSRRH